jgi:hypothetical protein
MDDFDIIEIRNEVLYGRCRLTGRFIKVNLNGR